MSGWIQTAQAAEGISVKLDPYIVGEFAGVAITSTMLTVWLAMFLIAVLVVSLGVLKKVPGKLQSIVEVVIGGAFNYMATTLGSKEAAKKYFPVVMTIFMFLLVMNWVGLLPGVTTIGLMEGYGDKSHLVPFFYPPATDLNIAIAFAVVAMATIWFAGVAALGVFKYASKFISFKSPLAFLVGIIELISEIGRLVSFSFRLFGNIFAGKTLLVVATFFVPFILPVPILAYEVFVGFIQAGVFAFLTLVFIKLAIEEPH
ncbi:MAG: F0F1 ATP synthase subunit A [Patescibacteria group bacterium]